MKDMSSRDLDAIRHALRTAREHGYRSVKLSVEDSRFSAVLSEMDEEEVEEFDLGLIEPAGPHYKDVESGAVGYVRFDGNALQVGNQVNAGDKIGEMVALGIVNDLVAPTNGKVAEICVEDGSAVEFGQVIARIEI